MGVLTKVVSGGQTGVDRAALDAAAACHLERGGWCPRGRRAEDGPLDHRYPLSETPSADYEERTLWNVRDSDATLVLAFGPPHGGTALALEVARRLGRRYRLVDLALPADARPVSAWIVAEAIRVLNVAGPRESEAPGVQAEAFRFLGDVFSSARISPSQGP